MPSLALMVIRTGRRRRTNPQVACNLLIIHPVEVRLENHSGGWSRRCVGKHARLSGRRRHRTSGFGRLGAGNARAARPCRNRPSASPFSRLRSADRSLSENARGATYTAQGLYVSRVAEWAPLQVLAQFKPNPAMPDYQWWVEELAKGGL